jgi:hypothetical protein
MWRPETMNGVGAYFNSGQRVCLVGGIQRAIVLSRALDNSAVFDRSVRRRRKRAEAKTA